MKNFIEKFIKKIQNSESEIVFSAQSILDENNYLTLVVPDGYMREKYEDIEGYKISKFMNGVFICINRSLMKWFIVDYHHYAQHLSKIYDFRQYKASEKKVYPNKVCVNVDVDDEENPQLEIVMFQNLDKKLTRKKRTIENIEKAKRQSDILLALFEIVRLKS